MVDVTSTRAGIVLAANAALAKLFGVGGGALTGIDVRSVFTPAKAWSQLVWQVRTMARPAQCERRWRCRTVS
jgi:hypothetical protein